MKNNQLTKGENRRVMYVENKDGELYGADARIGWVTFSKTGKTVYYKDKILKRSGGQGIRGNHYDEETREEYWVSGIKNEVPILIGLKVVMLRSMMMQRKNIKKLRKKHNDKCKRQNSRKPILHHWPRVIYS